MIDLTLSGDSLIGTLILTFIIASTLGILLGFIIAKD